MNIEIVFTLTWQFWRKTTRYYNTDWVKVQSPARGMTNAPQTCRSYFNVSEMTFKHSSKLNLSCSWASFNFPQKWRKWRNMLLQGILSWWVTSHSAELLTFCLLLSFYTDCACYWLDYVLFWPFNGEPLCTQYFPASGRVTSGKDWETLKRKTVKFTP